MARRRWSEQEISRLRTLYSSEASMDMLIEAFPGRTIQAIRQKASRLGLRKTAPPPPYSSILLWRGEGTSEGLLLRCSNCRSWIRVTLKKDLEDKRVRCGNCGYILYLGG